ncbi:hypothetical protein BDY21DRAFT_26204 [Lineolata rhizophorae]|uniref:Uncharacterized protein n=1 Tax=Lineolata rhizophorae TaxID=578093 RepID=A0A6A6P0A5_9PEZI|nr:hypothetical protein BDY21DRAFT_26204 [Lineolata rhizophorae]
MGALPSSLSRGGGAICSSPVPPPRRWRRRKRARARKADASLVRRKPPNQAGTPPFSASRAKPGVAPRRLPILLQGCASTPPSPAHLPFAVARRVPARPTNPTAWHADAGALRLEGASEHAFPGAPDGSFLSQKPANRAEASRPSRISRLCLGSRWRLESITETTGIGGILGKFHGRRRGQSTVRNLRSLPTA